MFEYPAKSGQERMQVVATASVRSVVCALHRRRPHGQRLLAFADSSQWHELDSADMNGHAAPSAPARKRSVSRTVSEVADYLGNTPAVCRRSYIDPPLIDRYLDGEAVRFPMDRLGAGTRPGWPATQGEFEAAVIRLLRD